MLSKIDEMRLLSSSKFLKQKEYWRKKLDEDMNKTGIPYHSYSEHGTVDEKSDLEFSLDGRLFERLLKLGKGSEISLYITLLTGLKILVYRYTGNKDITVVSPLYRPNINQETLNQFLLIRDSIHGDRTVKEALIAVRQSVLEAFENQDYPLDKLAEPNVSEIRCVLSDLHSPIDPSRWEEKLIFLFNREENRLAGKLLFHRGEYDEFMARQMKQHFINILEAGLEDIDGKVSQIPMQTEEEIKNLLENFNRDKSDKEDFCTRGTIYQYTGDQSRRIPWATAVLMEDSHVTYRELNRRSSGLAQRLRQCGVGKDSPVGIIMDRSSGMVESILATWKVHGAYIPIEPTDPVSRLHEILKDSAAAAVITQKIYIDASLHLPAKMSNPPVILLDPSAQEWENRDGSDSETPAHMNGLAYIIYTSGSTGKPKGVMIEHIGMMNHIRIKIRDLGITYQSIVAQNSAHTFDISVWQFFAALVRGGRTVIYPDKFIMDPGSFLTTVAAHRTTILEVVPSYLSLLLNHLETHFVDLPALEYLLLTGETAKPTLVDRWFDKYPGIKVVNAYGPTEASDDITHYTMQGPPGLNPIPIGKPLRNLTIYIVDDHMNFCPIGARGEICVSGVGVGRGYLNNPELTHDKFFLRRPGALFTLKGWGRRPLFEKTAPGPHKKVSLKVTPPKQIHGGQVPGAKLYKTGDLGCWLSDGTINFFGRKDSQVKIRGYRIELGEIECRLLSYFNIKEAVVMVRKNNFGIDSLCAYIVTAGPMDTHKLREYLAGLLPDYMIPSDFVKVEKIPLTPNGKIDRKATAALGEKLNTGSEYVPPQSDTEIILAGIWKEIIGLEEEVGINDNFFDLGGTSLDIIRASSRIKEEFKQDLPIVTLYRFTTIRLLAEYLREGEKEKKPVQTGRSDLLERGKSDIEKRRQLRAGRKT